uniref:Neur_chan_LBD domain-containing protein n=1 Tax=Panagrellus redivivus TaxID=6233 RepID=A0A7E4VUG1_PANRE
MTRRLILAVLLLLAIDGFVQGWIDTDKKLETAILRKYNRKHRPVKNDATTMQVEVFLMLNHVEKVDEKEQTMTLHGQLSASWMDEYLNWNPSEFNGTTMISIETWKIWQPAFALFNNAKAHGWHLFMNGLPATLLSTGRVFASGAFTFHTTCFFDFTNWPNDEQSCPIVIADWVYDLSKVNLSDPVSSHLKNPIIRLSFDPVNNGPKKHVSGWEVTRSWRKHCYWGPNGCLPEDSPPLGQLDAYWSLLEFGISLKRHVPYYWVTIVLPQMVIIFLTLLSFWVDDYSAALTICLLNVMLQGFCSWTLLKQLPPSNGNLPRIGYFFGINLVLISLSFAFHVICHFLLTVLPGDIEFPFILTNLTDRLREFKFFKVEGLSFDPQKVLFGEDALDTIDGPNGSVMTDIENSPMDSPVTETILVEMDDPGTIPLNDVHPIVEQQPETSSNNGDTTSATSVQSKPALAAESHLAEELYTLRRIIFGIYLVIFIGTIPWMLF